ncbi:hypothetical protein [uncultured Desulfobacter sp.]|uniref:hypothetical protein n=1 Tax=uncultured Desulfobacter sp. TaxID=240139 RepID=UPI0029F57723|nr:hypothetical protein [uncultured Desulfobacter sp.]
MNSEFFATEPLIMLSVIKVTAAGRLRKSPKAVHTSFSVEARMLSKKSRSIAKKPVLQRKGLSQFQKIFAVLVAASIRALTETAFGLFYVKPRIT